MDQEGIWDGQVQGYPELLFPGEKDLGGEGLIMETWASVFAYFLVDWWAGLTFALCFHFAIYYMSAKYAANFDSHKD